MTSLAKKIKFRPYHSNLASSFIKKTYEILEDQQFTDIVDWNDEGNALVIKKPQEFAQQVLPTYFKHGNITSFVRQLNMYDFHKRRTSKYDHVYYHDLFHKDKKHLLKDIKRKNQENTLTSIQKAIDALESVKETEKNDANFNSFEYENQLLKKLNKDALARIVSLETKVKDLTIQNQELWYQISHQNQKEDVLVSFFASFMKKKGIPLEQLSKILTTQLGLPSLDFAFKTPSFPDINTDPIEEDKYPQYEAPKSPTNTANFFNFEHSTNPSTNYSDISPNFPFSRSLSKSTQQFNVSKSITPINPSPNGFQSKDFIHHGPNQNHFNFPPHAWEAQNRGEMNSCAYGFQNTKVFEEVNGKCNLNPNIGKFPQDSEILGKRKIDMEQKSFKGNIKQVKRDGVLNTQYNGNTYVEQEGTYMKEDFGGSLMTNKFNTYGEVIIDVHDQYNRNLDLNDFN